MKLSLLIVLLLVSSPVLAKVIAEVNISPAGSFSVKSGSIKGSVTRTKDGFTAKKLSVKVKSLKTGVELRDKHLREKLGSDSHPSISLYRVNAKNGRGVGILKIKGIKRKIGFTYKIDGKNIIADFKINLTDFKISGISYMGVGVKDIVEVKATL